VSNEFERIVEKFVGSLYTVAVTVVEVAVVIMYVRCNVSRCCLCQGTSL